MTFLSSSRHSSGRPDAYRASFLLSFFSFSSSSLNHLTLRSPLTRGDKFLGDFLFTSSHSNYSRDSIVLFLCPVKTRSSLLLPHPLLTQWSGKTVGVQEEERKTPAATVRILDRRARERERESRVTRETERATSSRGESRREMKREEEFHYRAARIGDYFVPCK